MSNAEHAELFERIQQQMLLEVERISKEEIKGDSEETLDIDTATYSNFDDTLHIRIPRQSPL